MIVSLYLTNQSKVVWATTVNYDRNPDYKPVEKSVILNTLKDNIYLFFIQNRKCEKCSKSTG